MSKKGTSLQGYGDWLLGQCSTFSEVEAKVAVVTAPNHPKDHKFVESREFPGTCATCGWIDPATASDCDCPQTLSQHIAELPAVLEEAAMVAQVMSMVMGGR